MAEAKRRELCEELDRSLLEVMESLKQLSSLRNKYREDVKEGYLAMSQARHAMGGPSHVSSLQYDCSMRSLVHVDPSPDDLNHLEDPSLEDKSSNIHPEFKVQRRKPGNEVVRPKLGAEPPREGMVRHRKGEESVEEVPMGSQEVCGELKDPIKWFGILVPQNLHRAQQCFVQAIYDSAELAAAQTRLVLAHKRYQDLQLKKRKLSS